MTRSSDPGLGTPARLVAIGAAIALMIAAILGAHARLENRQPPGGDAPAAAAPPAVGSPPIPAEANVFRTRPSDVAPPPGAERRPDAHPRTMAYYRPLRAYPGAPPRIPHGLMPEEFRSSSCGPCHARGSYVERFASYAPITPHPEQVNCVQCHVPDDRLIGVPFPDGSPESICLQCHVPGSADPLFVPTDWRPADWPETEQRAMDGSPPRIPHDFQYRSNCLTCHMAPSGVEEIRTPHPERANCRQCHVPVGDAADGDVFRRPMDRGAETSDAPSPGAAARPVAGGGR